MRSTDTFPSLCVNEAGYGRERSGPDLPFSPRALSSRGRRTPQTIKHVASRGRAAALLLAREVFTSVCCCWSLFRAIICRSEQSIQPRQLQPPLVRTSLECLCMSRGAQNRHQLTHPHGHTDTHIQTDIFKLMLRITHSHINTCMCKAHGPEWQIYRCIYIKHKNTFSHIQTIILIFKECYFFSLAYDILIFVSGLISQLSIKEMILYTINKQQ